MKAAVLHQPGSTPRCEDFPDPIIGENELLVHVKAVSLENVDRATARGTHFATRQFFPQLPAIVGFDGIGALDDGRLIGFGGIRPPYGAMAERTVIQNGYYVPIPEGVDAVTAAAIPGPALTALFPLKWGAALQPGQTVLINGATGFAGRLAVQVARLVGAGRIVGSGRNPVSLGQLIDLGADAVIDLKQPDEALAEAFRREAGETGYHVILDFLWGHPTELLIQSLVPDKLVFARHPVRLIQVGEMAGPTLSLPADAVRTSGLEIIGGGSGLTPEAMAEGAAQVWDWIRTGKLRYELEPVPLRDIESAWARQDVGGKRLVIVP
jgi:NADPH2:quinone reductase